MLNASNVRAGDRTEGVETYDVITAAAAEFLEYRLVTFLLRNKQPTDFKQLQALATILVTTSGALW